jgi:ribosomal protein S12 methylthiotransferase
MDVLVESQRGEDGAVARSWRDAPEIDGTVLIRPANGEPIPAPGTWQRVRVVEAQPYDLIAETCAI